MATETYTWDELNERADDAFRTVPEGIYQAKCVAAQPDKSKGGKHMIRGRWQITTGPEAGQTLLSNIVLSPENDQAVAYFRRNLAAHGIDTKTFTGPVSDTIPTIASRMLTASVQITVTHREYNDEIRADIDRFEPSRTGPPPPPPASSSAPAPSAPPAPPPPPPPPAAPTPSSPAPPPPPPPVVETPAPAPEPEDAILPPPPPPVLLS